jgi:hypothetical protein
VNNDTLGTYVGLISGVLAITGAVVLILAAIILTEFRPVFGYHLSSGEVSWISFLAGVEAAGILSLIYGFSLHNGKLSSLKDNNVLATIAFWSGAVIMAVAFAGLVVPAAGGH